MKSKIIDRKDDLIISTPKIKSWVLIIFLSLFTLQFTNAIIQSLFFINDLPIVVRILIAIVSSIIAYFTSRELMWQLKGFREIRLNKTELILTKISPFRTTSKSYRISEIKLWEIQDSSVTVGPLAMLQLLRITDKIKVTFSYGYETILATSGIDLVEAEEIREKIKNRIASNSLSN